MAGPAYRVIDVLRKGRKSGYVIASTSLLEETAAYMAQYRNAWLKRAARKRRAPLRFELFINRRGAPVKRTPIKGRSAALGRSAVSRRCLTCCAPRSGA